MIPSSSRSTLQNVETLSRDFSLASFTSSTSQPDEYFVSSSSQQDEYFQSDDHAENTLRNIRTYFDNRQLCDVTLIAGIDGKR